MFSSPGGEKSHLLAIEISGSFSFKLPTYRIAAVKNLSLSAGNTLWFAITTR